jgi:hypothetical protein
MLGNWGRLLREACSRGEQEQGEVEVAVCEGVMYFLGVEGEWEDEEEGEGQPQQ